MRKRIALPLLIVIGPGQGDEEEKKGRDVESILVLIVSRIFVESFISLFNKVIEIVMVKQN